MKFVYNGICVHYETYGKKCEKATLLLHGWGSSGKVFDGLVDAFSGERYFVVPDFPPFGESESLVCSWTIFSYASMVMSLCEHLGIKEVDILGHSFGGRIAILLAGLECSFVQSCILVDSAGLKPKFSIKSRLKIIKYKTKKFLGKNVENMGSTDYQTLPPCMRGVFVNVVNTFLEPYLSKIQSRTLIVWGQNDKDTPLYMAKRFKRKIKNSSLVVLNGGHFVFLDCPLAFYKVVREFWEAK